MLLHTELQGEHLPNKGEGITLEDLFQLLKIIPSRARSNSYVSCAGSDVIGIALGQNNQAEKWEFKAHIKLEGSNAI